MKIAATALAAALIAGCTTVVNRPMTVSEWDACVKRVEKEILTEGGTAGGSVLWTADGTESGVIVFERCGKLPRKYAEDINHAVNYCRHEQKCFQETRK